MARLALGAAGALLERAEAWIAGRLERVGAEREPFTREAAEMIAANKVEGLRALLAVRGRKVDPLVVGEGAAREPLMGQALSLGRLDCARALREAGVSLDRLDSRGRSPIERAAGSGRCEALRWAVESGAKLGSWGSPRSPAVLTLEAAARAPAGQLECVELLCEAMGPPPAEVRGRALNRAGDAELFDLAARLAALPGWEGSVEAADAEEPGEHTLLMWAARARCFEAARALMPMSRIDARRGEGNDAIDALMVAAQFPGPGASGLALALIDAGAPVDGPRLLRLAAGGSDSEELIERLMGLGLDPRNPVGSGACSLGWAATNVSAAPMRALLPRFDLRGADRELDALSICAAAGPGASAEVARLLVAAGAAVDLDVLRLALESGADAVAVELSGHASREDAAWAAEATLGPCGCQNPEEVRSAFTARLESFELGQGVSEPNPASRSRRI